MQGWEFGWSEIIAAGALIVAAIGWWDSRRRIMRDEVSFVIEPGRGEGEYLLRNTGKRRIEHQWIDEASVSGYRLDRNTMGPRGLDRDEAVGFKLSPDAWGRMPDTVRVLYRRKLPGKQYSLSVRLPS